jgi:nitrogen fixation/metabolism regulation signal transduction histidine kinase
MVMSNLAQEKKIQALSYFDEWQIIAGKLAHEINNPLTPIQMMVSNLSRLHEKSDRVSFAQSLNNTENVVSEEIEKLKGMVRHFNKFSKLPEPDFQYLDLLSHLTQFIEQYSPAWQSVNFTVDIAANIDQNQGIVIKADGILLNQCFINLVNNAIQANPHINPLKIKFSLAIQRTENKDHWLKLIVFNQGRVIAKKERENIFKLYYSVKHTSQSSENMGLGLAIVRKIILDHKGDIQCLSSNEGAAFEVSLPLMSRNSSSCIVKEGSHGAT